MSRGRKLAIGAMCAVLVATLPATAQAVFPGNNGKILFVSGRDGGDAQADTYIIDGPSDTTLDGPTDLIAGQHRHPVWSADGRFIVYAIRVADAGCTPATDEDLYIHDTLGIGGTVIFHPSANCILEDHPAFSPDGSKVAYESEVGTQSDIMIANADGSGTPQNLTNSTGVLEFTPAWSPNGRFIYYARRFTAQTELDIYRQRADGTGTPSFITISATNEFQPELSPDGAKVCYTAGPFGSPEADILVENVDGSGSPVEISPPDSTTPPVAVDADYDCGWSPEGKTIAFTRGTFGNGQLQFAPSNDSGPVTPYGNNSAFFEGNVDWAPIPGDCNGKPATIAGDDGNDQIAGTSGKDIIVTFKGNDRVNGRGGNDQICGGKGGDTLSGAKGRDKLFGQKGGDKLNGGPDRDRCDGGPGNDAASRCERRDKVES